MRAGVLERVVASRNVEKCDLAVADDEGLRLTLGDV
jgi:hypothetical protein